MLKAQHVALPGQEAVQLPQADKRCQLFQNLLLVVKPQGNVLGDEVRQIPHVPAIHHRGDHFLRDAAGQLRILAEQVPGLPQQGLGPGAALEGLGLGGLLQLLHVGLEEGLRLPQAAQAGAAAALHHHPDGVLGQPQNLGDVGNGAHRVQVLFSRRFRADLPLSHQENFLVLLHGPL